MSDDFLWLRIFMIQKAKLANLLQIMNKLFHRIQQIFQKQAGGRIMEFSLHRSLHTSSILYPKWFVINSLQTINKICTDELVFVTCYEDILCKILTWPSRTSQCNQEDKVKLWGTDLKDNQVLKYTEWSVIWQRYFLSTSHCIWRDTHISFFLYNTFATLSQ